MSFALILLAVVLASAAVLLYQYWTGAMLEDQPRDRTASPSSPRQIAPGTRIDHAA